ncbi:hypothetical protein ACJMK2_042025 [Sinanodonta woodiana]|uniref:Methylthioribose-1-phosphate isomerase n=1 Tax=Sinanodonta woodiana TaxID=1069815 RepID=A0ABD3W619_SINWO
MASNKKIKLTLESIKYKHGQLEILDQLLIPDSHEFIPVNDTSDAWRAIKLMQVRGAPAIAIVGCLSLAVELHNKEFDNKQSLVDHICKQLEYLVTSRPTAVNMKEAAHRFSALAQALTDDENYSKDDVKQLMIEELELMLEDDIATNKAIGKNGAEHILGYSNDQPVCILTHCNTGSLATAGYGTALGVVRRLHELGKLNHAFCTETRPYNQGSRLTAYELVYEKIPATLICDSMVSMVMKNKGISAVVVGADRVVRNGDTANKIGTYQLAICAKYHNIPFYVACPVTTFDPNMKTGEEIHIEERPHLEMTRVKGVSLAPDGINCYNPAFDVTPAELITGGIITEYGVFLPGELHNCLTTIEKSKHEEFPRSRSRTNFQVFTER